MELFNRCLEVSEEVNEARLAIVDVFGLCSCSCNFPLHSTFLTSAIDHMMSILRDSVKHLRLCSTGKISPPFSQLLTFPLLSQDSEAMRSWPQLDMNINGHLSELDASVKHLNDINSLSKVNLERQIKDITIRHAAVPGPEEHATFPLTMLQGQQNEQFYGREEDLKKLEKALDWRDNPPLRSMSAFSYLFHLGSDKLDIYTDHYSLRYF